MDDLVEGFLPVASKESQILILGSMPGVVSLQQNQYYAHPRNAFWSIIEAFFEIPRTAPYKERVRILKNKNVALWDVLKQCHRQGSLDTSIKAGSIQTNEFIPFFQNHSQVQFVFFNGKKAEYLFHKYVYNSCTVLFPDLEFRGLPSTSPAHATLSVEEKIEKWYPVKEAFLESTNNA